MKSRNYLWLFLFLNICSISLSGQGWERYYNPSPINFNVVHQVYPTPDLGYLIITDDPDVQGSSALKTDFAGEMQDYKTNSCNQPGFGSTQLKNGNLLRTGIDRDPINPSDRIIVLETLDLGGNLLTCTSFPAGDFLVRQAEETDDGNIYLLGEELSEPVIMKIDFNGSLIWKKTITGFNNGMTMSKTRDGGVLVITSVDAGAQCNCTEMYKFDADGNELWRNNMVGFYNRYVKPVENSAGEFYFSAWQYQRGGFWETIVYKLNNLGNVIALYAIPRDSGGEQAEIFDLELSPTEDVLIGAKYSYSNSSILNFPFRFSIIKTNRFLDPLSKNDFAGTLDEHLTNGTTEYRNAKDFIQLDNGGYVITGEYFNTVTSNTDIFLFKTDSLGNTTTNQICGKIAYDENDNCTIDAGERPMSIPQILQLVQGTDTAYFSTNSTGDFAIRTDTGDYELRLISTNSLWESCVTSQSISHQNLYDTSKVNFPLKALVECPNLSVDIGSTRLRRCRTSTFTVQYCNEGTIDGEDAYVEVQLDTFLTLDRSDIPGTNIGGNTWRFDLGTIELFECGFFQFDANVDCGASVTGRTLCAEAHIFPDTLCLPPPANWSKADLSVNGECKGNEIVFTIKNTGAGDMIADQNYIVIEDIAVMRPGSPFQLSAGQEIKIPVTATGSTIRLEVPQPDNHPYGGKVSSTVEFCGNPPFTTGLFNQLGHNKNNPAIKTYCARVLNGYDPNEKLASPTGFRDKREIASDQELDYEIHFQNTGNDTAFRVVLLDTLAANVDLKTLRVGASSHPYEWDMFGDRILRFTFENIHLVDSFTNVLGSQGFVRYSIEPKPGLPVATEIRNAADIYFDFNAPIYTNQTLHTIGFEDFDGDGVAAIDDCDDFNPDVGTASTEIPNNDIDEDCDGIAQVIDEDGDGFNSDEDCDDSNASINSAATEIPNNDIDEDCDGIAQIIDEDGDGFNSDEDCDDSNASINSAATEIPNNDIDEDCDGIAQIIDEDGDGFNSDEDCDDSNASINSAATEIPNNDIDEDCDGIAQIIDEDGDGFNSDEDCDDSNASINSDATEIPNNDIDEDCDGIAQIIDLDGDGFNSDEDCDDSNAEINSAATEIPNNDIDEDCDGIAQIIDLDGDGFNSDEDCDDSNAEINSAATEIPNNDIDEDCDGIAQIIDVDGDGFNSDEDCDDSNAEINSAATEIPNNDIDEDCDGVAQIIDLDGDGFNSDEDCDDENAAINPDATEIPNNDIDEDCNGSALIIDNDMDGFNSDEDCDDEDASINPGATEIPNNDIDENCDSTILIIDVDMDGFNSDEDCDDSNAAINPDAIEIPDNGIDEDCDGMDATSGTEELFLKTLKIYPNPADEFISIEINEFLNDDLTIQLLNVSGQLVKKDLMKENTQYLKIDTRIFAEGIYFIRLTSGEEVRIAKVFLSRK